MTKVELITYWVSPTLGLQRDIQLHRGLTPAVAVEQAKTWVEQGPDPLRGDVPQAVVRCGNRTKTFTQGGAA